MVNIQDDPSMIPGKIELTDQQKDGYRLIQLYFGQLPTTAQWRKVLYRMNAYDAAHSYLTKHGEIPHLLHAHVLLDAGMIGNNWAKKWAVPLVITEHSTAYHEAHALRGLRGVLGRAACKNAAFVLPVSDHLGRGMQELNGLVGNYRQVSNVVNTRLFHYVTPPDDGVFTFLHVSNFVDAHKNITGLLRAFGQVDAQTRRVIHLHLAGDGNLFELQSKIDLAGLTLDQVTISGPHSETAIAALMQQCHAFVLPSHYENEPVVLLEAQASGRPCVATRTGGIPEIMAHPRCGELVEPNDEAGLVTAMLKVLDNYPFYDPAVIRSLAEARCSEPAVLKALEEVYQTAIR